MTYLASDTPSLEASAGAKPQKSAPKSFSSRFHLPSTSQAILWSAAGTCIILGCSLVDLSAPTNPRSARWLLETTRLTHENFRYNVSLLLSNNKLSLIVAGVAAIGFYLFLNLKTFAFYAEEPTSVIQGTNADAFLQSKKSVSANQSNQAAKDTLYNYSAKPIKQKTTTETAAFSHTLPAIQTPNKSALAQEPSEKRATIIKFIPPWTSSNQTGDIAGHFGPFPEQLVSGETRGAPCSFPSITPLAQEEKSFAALEPTSADSHKIQHAVQRMEPPQLRYQQLHPHWVEPSVQYDEALGSRRHRPFCTNKQFSSLESNHNVLTDCSSSMYHYQNRHPPKLWNSLPPCAYNASGFNAFPHCSGNDAAPAWAPHPSNYSHKNSQCPLQCIPETTNSFNMALDSMSSASFIPPLPQCAESEMQMHRQTVARSPWCSNYRPEFEKQNNYYLQCSPRARDPQCRDFQQAGGHYRKGVTRKHFKPKEVFFRGDALEDARNNLMPRWSTNDMLSVPRVSFREVSRLGHMSVGELTHFFSLPENRSSLKQFYTHLFESVDMLSPSLAADLLRLPVKLQQPNSGVTEALCRCILSHPPAARNLSSMQLALAAWSLARSDMSRNPICFATMQSLAEEALLCLKEFQPLSIANFFWACGKLKYKNKLLIQGLAKAAVVQLDQFNAQNIANTYWSLGSLEFSETLLTPKNNVGFSSSKFGHSDSGGSCRWNDNTDSPASWDAHLVQSSWIYDVLSAKLPSFNPQALANFLWACAKLHWTGEINATDSPATSPTLASNTKRSCFQKKDSLVVRAASLASRRTHECKPQEISNIMWALAKLGATETTADVCRLANRAAETLKYFNSQEVSNAYWAVGTLELRRTLLTPYSLTRPIQNWASTPNDSISLTEGYAHNVLSLSLSAADQKSSNPTAWSRTHGCQSCASLATPSTTESLGSPLLDGWRPCSSASLQLKNATKTLDQGNQPLDETYEHDTTMLSNDVGLSALDHNTATTFSVDNQTLHGSPALTGHQHQHPAHQSKAERLDAKHDDFQSLKAGHFSTRENTAEAALVCSTSETTLRSCNSVGGAAEVKLLNEDAKPVQIEADEAQQLVLCYPECSDQERLLLAVLLEKMQQFNAQAIANLLWSCGKLQWKCEDVCAASYEVVKRNIASFQPQNIANYLWAMAKLRLKNEKIVHLLTKRAAEHLADFNTQELANVYWAIGTLEVKDSDLTCCELLEDYADDNATSEAHRTASTILAVSNGTEDHSNDVAKKRSFECSDKKHGQMFNGKPDYKQLTVDVLCERLQYFKPQELANFLWACARLKWKPTRILQQAVTAALRLYDKFKPQEIGNVVWALAKLNYPSVELLSEMCSNTTDNIQLFSAQNVANIYWGLGTLNISQTNLTSDHPSPQFISRLLVLIKKFNDQEVTNFIWACGRLRWEHEDVMEVAIDVLWNHVNRLRYNELTSLQNAFR